MQSKSFNFCEWVATILTLYLGLPGTAQIQSQSSHFCEWVHWVATILTLYWCLPGTAEIQPKSFRLSYLCIYSPLQNYGRFCFTLSQADPLLYAREYIKYIEI